MSLAQSLFQADQLTAAIQALNADLQTHANDVPARSLLVELLCLNGDLDRADKQLNTLAKQNPDKAVSVAMRRHVLRAAQARAEVFSQGRVPGFFVKPDSTLQQQLKLLTALQAEDVKTAAKVLAKLDSKPPQLHLTINGNAFQSLRDCDDRTAYCLEVMALNGEYYWVPWQLIRRIEFKKPQRPIDLTWRQARIHLQNDIEQDFLLPAIYYGTAIDNEKALLGRQTDWQTLGDAISIGHGQRVFLADDDVINMLDIDEINVKQAL